MKFNSYLDWIDSCQEQLIETLHDWCLTNSGSHNLEGLNTMHDKIRHEFEPLQGQAESFELQPLSVLNDDGVLVKQEQGKALRIIKRPEAKKQVLLCGHMDTVFAVDHTFQSYQYLDDNTINGPGVADMKGGILVMLTALQALERSPFASEIGWEVLINPDEEIGSSGSAQLLTESAKRNHIGLLYEPSMPDGTLAGARKGSGNFSLMVKGKAAHAGREHHLGRNAIVALSEAIGELNELNNQSETITINVGRVVGGGAVNVVPDMAICHFNIRVLQENDQQQAEKWIEKILEGLNKRVDYSAELYGGFNRPAKPFNQQQEKLFTLLKNCGEELGLEIEHVATGGCCDGNNLLAAGLPNIDTLGVRGGKIHSADEYMFIDSLVERAKLSALLLMRFASEENVFVNESVGN